MSELRTNRKSQSDDSITLVTESGRTVTLEGAVVSYVPEGVMLPAGFEAFSLGWAIEADEIDEIAIATSKAPQYRVLFRDGAVVTVDAGGVRFSGTISESNE